MQNKTEPELISLSLNENHQAYAELVNRYKNTLYHHCFAIVRNEDAAEDLTQETFTTAYYKLSLYKSEFRLSTWLFKIATNKSLNWLRKASKEIVADDDVIERIVSKQPGPDRSALHNELRSAVGRLQPKHKAVISLYYWQGLSYDEIAHVLGSPIGSVKGWMRRAKLQLRKELS